MGKSSDAHPPCHLHESMRNCFARQVLRTQLPQEVPNGQFAGNGRCSYCAIHIAAQACGRGCCAAAAESGRIILATPATPWHISQEALAAAE
jgi:hypothetical protein